MEREIKGKKAIVQILGHTGNPQSVNISSPSTKLRMELTHVEDLKIGDKMIVKYYEGDIVVQSIIEKRPVADWRMRIRMNPVFFTLWHKGAVIPSELKELLIDAWMTDNKVSV
jgi:hypothetical protein